MITWLEWLPQGWLTLTVAIGLLLLMASYLGYGPPGVLRTRTRQKIPEAHFGGYSKEQLVEFGRLAGREPYRSQLWWDMLFALAYGAGLIAIVNGTFGWSLTPNGRLFLLGYVPFALIFVDLLEDVLLLVATRAAAPCQWGPRGLVTIARATTITKFSLATISALLVVTGAIALGILGHRHWTAAYLAELTLASLALLLFHLALTLSIPPRAKHARAARTFEWELLSAGIKLIVASNLLLWGAKWYFHWFPFAQTSLAGTTRTLGLDVTGGWLWRLAIWGGSFSGAIVAGLIVAFRFVGPARRKAVDSRFENLTISAVTMKIVLIFVGTVALEELLFRGLLFSAVRAAYPRLEYPVVISAVVFGLWHIGPALRDEERRRPLELKEALLTEPVDAEARNKLDEAKDELKGRRTSATIGTVAVMVAAGVGFGLLRIWSGGVWAPALVHFTANSGGVVFAWRSARRAELDSKRAARSAAG